MSAATVTRRVWGLAAAVAVIVLAASIALCAREPFVLERASGWWAFGLLAASLAVTPLRATLRGRARLAVVLHRARRPLGLGAAAAATLHAALSLTSYFGAAAPLGPTLTALSGSPWLRDAVLALSLLLALALGSVTPLARRLRAWSALHRLVYPAALLAALHALLGPRSGDGAWLAIAVISLALAVRPAAAWIAHRRGPLG